MYPRMALPGWAMYMTYGYLNPLHFVCSPAVFTQKSPKAFHRTSTNVNVGKSCLPGNSCVVPAWVIDCNPSWQNKSQPEKKYIGASRYKRLLCLKNCHHHVDHPRSEPLLGRKGVAKTLGQCLD